MRAFRSVSALALAAGVTGLPLAVAAQDARQQPAQVPIALVSALVGSRFTGGPNAAQIFVGAAPNGIAAADLPPKPVSILGGMSSGGYRTVILVYPATDSAPSASYMKFLESSGWAHPKMEFQRSGFIEANELRMRPTTLCRDSAHVTILRVSGAPSGSTWLRADFYAERGMGICTARPRTDYTQELVFPALEAPPGSRTVGTSGGGGSPDTRGISTTLQSALTPSQVLTHYAAQLAKSGWTIGAPLTGDSLSAERVSARDTKGNEWSGVLTVVSAGGESHVALQMAKRSGS